MRNFFVAWLLKNSFLNFISYKAFAVRLQCLFCDLRFKIKMAAICCTTKYHEYFYWMLDKKERNRQRYFYQNHPVGHYFFYVTRFILIGFGPTFYSTNSRQSSPLTIRKSFDLIRWCSCLSRRPKGWASSHQVRYIIDCPLILSFDDQIYPCARELLPSPLIFVLLCLGAWHVQTDGVVLPYLLVLAWTRRILS